MLLLFDGWAYMHLIPTPTILDNLLAERRIPPLVAVMVDNAPGARDRELGCYEPFVDFLTQELLPWVRRRYHVTGDPAWSTIGGSSRGGLTAAFTGLRRPDLFGNVLCQSGAFMWAPPGDPEPGWLVCQFADHARLPLRFYVDVGRLEVWPSPDDGPSTRVANQHMRDVLHAKGYPVHYAEFGGGHDYTCWEGTLPDGLLFLLGERRPARTSAT